MNPWFGRGAFLAIFVLSILIRAPHDTRRKEVKVVESRRSVLEIVLLAAVAIGHGLLPLISLTPLLGFAEYPLHPGALAAGIVIGCAALWLFHRSHADLGTNWSPTLEVRQGHELVTRGVYARIRHPMYAAIFLIVLAQALLVSNAVAGPAGFVAFALMFLLRFRKEERMMVEKFGQQYLDYAARTKRLIPGVW